MRFRAAFRILSAAIALLLQGLTASAAEPARSDYVPDQLLIKFRPTAPARAASAITEALGADRVRTFERFGIEVLRVPEGTVQAAVERYRDDPAVEYVEPNYRWHVSTLPNDPYFPNLWGMQNTGQTGGTPGADIRAPQAWSVFTGSSLVLVGIIDTGIDYNHPDLASNVWANPGEIPGNGLDDDNNGFVDDVHGWDFVNADNDPMDDYGHGTHVSGTIAAMGNNGQGVVGVCWNAKLVGLKFLDSSGYGSSEGAIAAIDYAIANGVRVINASWGGGGYSQGLYDAIQAAGQAGIVFVAAAGNSSLDTDVYPNYPSAYDLPSIVAVAATTHNDVLAYFSNWGATTVDLAAPGDNILSTVPGNSYLQASGTSMATPHVAGTLALLFGRFPGLSVAGAKGQLLSHVHPLASLAGKVLTGGRLDAYAAISDPDTLPPAGVTDLSVPDVQGDHVTLAWTATGDDGLTGTAFSYDVRYSTAPIDAGNFTSATPAQGEPEPAPAGTPQQMVVHGLGFAQTWYFAMRVHDESDNPSPVSNLASALTLGPPDIDVPPDTLTADLLTGQTLTRTLTVSNLGVSALSLEADVQNDSGPALQLAPAGRSAPARVLGRGHRVPLSQIPVRAPIARQIRIGATATGATGAAVVDRGTAPGRGAGSGYFALSGNEEVFGGAENGFYGGPRTRGNIFQCTTERLLKEHRLYLVPGSGTQLWFVVYEGTASSGTFTLVSASRVDPVGTSEGWYSSGTVDVPLVPGRYYVVAGTWDLPGGYFNRQNISPYPIPASFGSLIAGLGWYWAPEPALPPAPGLVVPPEVYGDYVAYYQTIVTDNLMRWLLVAPAVAEVPAGQSVDLAVTFDAEGLDGGDYRARIALRSNDPVDPVAYVGAHLHVTGAPDVTAEPAAIEFDSLFSGGTRVDSVTVRNTGTDILTVSGLDLTGAAFSAPAGGFQLAPRQKRALPVTFHPLVTGDHAGQLVVHSDDPDQPDLAVPLHGTALDPPDVVVAPDSLRADLLTGATLTVPLTVSNTGIAPLEWRVRMHRPPAAPAAGGGGLAVTSREELGTVDATKPANAPAASHQALRVRYGPAVTQDRLLVYSDDYARPPGQHVVDLALQRLGLPYTAVYYDPATFGAALSAGGWDIVIVDHDGYYELGQWWSELETFYLAGGRLLISTFDVDGSNSEPTTLWSTIGLRPAADLPYQVPPMAWWEPASPIFNDPESVPTLTSFSSLYYDSGDRTEVLAPATSPAGFTPSYAAGQSGIVMSRDERAIVNSFLPSTAMEDADGDGRLDAAELLTDEIALLAGSISWLSAEPSSGTVAPGGSAGLAVTFDAGSLFGGDYRADLLVLSNDPDEGELRVPAHLKVTGAPDIVLLGTERRATSTLAYGGSGSATQHVLMFSGSTANGAELRVRVDGDYGNGGETATVSAEGHPLGAVGEVGNDCMPDSGTFVIDPALLQTLAADGVVHVTVQNSYYVDAFCALNQHTVTLVWRGPADSLDVGVQFVDGCRSETLQVANQGTDTLIVSSLTTGDPRFNVTPASFHLGPMASRPVAVGFCPSAPGPVEATLTIVSNDPDAGVVGVALRGIGVPPPDIAVAAESLFVEMGPNEVVNRTLAIANRGDGPLVWKARTLDNPPAGAMIASPETVRLQLRGERAMVADVRPDGVEPQALPTPMPVPITGSASLEHVRGALDAGHHAITGLVPSRFDFAEGDSGFAILDGGSNMYDGGNLLETAYGGWLAYTGGLITSHPLVGPNGRYFTRKYPGLFVLAADLDGVPMFGTEGDLGADGYGTADGFAFSFLSFGHRFHAFAKRVYGAPVPSVNHIFIVPDTSGAHDWSYFTNSDYHVVYGLPGGRLYYLLFSSASGGGYVDDGTMQAIAQRFMDVVQNGSGRVALDAGGGGVPAGGNGGLGVIFQTAGLVGGTYDTQILLESNDPDEPLISVPTRLHVLGIPDIAVTPVALEFDSLFVGLSRSDSVRVANIGSDVLTVSGLDANPAAFTVDGSGFTLAPGASRIVPVTFLPGSDGTFAGTLVVHSDDPDHPDWTVPLHGTGLIAPDLRVRPDSLFVEAGPNETHVRTLTVSNHGGSRLDWTAGPGYTLATANAEGSMTIATETTAPATEHHPGDGGPPPAPGALAALVMARNASLAPGAVVFQDDMEQGTNGWTTVTYSSPDLWHLTTRSWNSAGHSWWCGIESQGNYETGSRIRNGVVSPDIDLRTAVAPVTLQFMESFSTEPGWDRCGVEVSPDGGASWGMLRTPPTGSSNGWRLTSLDLSGYAGAVVRIRFYFDTVDGAVNNYPGWFVDDVLVTSAVAPWLAVSPLAGSVAAGDSVPIDVTFTSGGLLGGNYDARVDLNSNDPDQPLIRVPARLHVLGVPDVAVTPDSVDFGSMFVGLTRTDSVLVRNVGTDVLTVSGSTASPAPFTADGAGFVLPPGASRRVRVTFAPSVPGTVTGSLVIHSDDPDHPDLAVRVRGTGLVPPDVAVHPDSLFAELGPNVIQYQWFTVLNRGGSVLNWSVVVNAVGASSQPAWIALNPVSGAVAPHDSVRVQVWFNSTGLLGGRYDVRLLVNSNDPDQPQVGIGVQMHVLGLPDIAVVPDALDFGPVYVGFGDADSVRVFNNGTDDLIVSRLQVSPAVFTADSGGFVLPRGASHTVHLRFLPDDAGFFTGNLVIHSNDPDIPHWTEPLSGTGVLPPDIAVSPESLEVALGVDETVSRSVTVANDGGSPLEWRVLGGYSLAPAGAAAARRAAAAGRPGDRRSGSHARVAPGGGLTALVEARIASLPPGSIVFHDDMEHGPNGWTTITYAVDDLWHQTGYTWTSASHSWWCASDSTGNYATGRSIRNALVSPSIDLRNGTAPLSLEFAENFETEPGYDECSVWVSTDDGGTWQLVRWPASGSSGGWQLTTLDLSPYAGQMIRIRFYFQARDTWNNGFPGWFVDDVIVTSSVPWLTVTPTLGTLPAGESTPVQVTLSSVGLPGGAYDAMLNVASNDPDEGIVVVPIRMNVGITVTDAPLPTGQFGLAPVRPNVARGQAIVEFELTRAGHAQAAIYDVAGRRVKVIAERDFAPGRYRFAWRGDAKGGGHLPAGVYLLRLVSPEGERVRRFVWVP